jgi:hypothetical protein
MLGLKIHATLLFQLAIMPPKKKKENNWRTCAGRMLLCSDIRNGDIPANMDWRTAFHRRAEFAVGETPDEALRLFESRLKSARKILSSRDARASVEHAMLREDRQCIPIPTTNHRGEPRWEGSQAQKLLKKDIADGKHKAMTRMDFYQSRSEYQQFFKSTIDGKAVQEEKLIKFTKQYRARFGYRDF